MSNIADEIDIEGTLLGHHPNVRLYKDLMVAVYTAGIAQSQIAKHLGGEAGRTMANAVGATMAEWDDWFCGNGRVPGPRPHFLIAQEVAVQLAAGAVNLPEDSTLRSDTLNAASGLSRAAFRAASGEA